MNATLLPDVLRDQVSCVTASTVNIENFRSERSFLWQKENQESTFVSSDREERLGEDFSGSATCPFRKELTMISTLGRKELTFNIGSPRVGFGRVTRGIR